MEKYGVNEDNTDGKVAEARDSQKCPSCGNLLSPPDETGVFHCPICGTKPFEGK